VHTGPKANTNKKHKQADLRGSPKTGTSMEAADCILLEEWYKHSTQPNTTLQNPVFHSYTRCFSLICTCTHSHSCTLYSLSSLALTTLALHTSFVSFSLSLSTFYRRNGSINIVVEKERVVDSGEGGWRWLRKMLTICYKMKGYLWMLQMERH